MTLAGRVAAITGASSGIGLASAEAMAREGVAVVLGARRADRLAVAVERIRKAGGRAEAVTMDVAKEADVRRLVDHAMAVFGRLDIMLCNAGFGYYGTIEETPPDILRRMVEVNFIGTYLGARAAVPIFRQQGRGHLLIMSSIVGRRGIPLMSGYCATKSAQIGFAEALRSEFTATDIHVSIIYPVSTVTEFRAAMERDFGYTASGLGPKQTPEQVAEAVLRCVKRPTAEVYPWTQSRALAIASVVAPGLIDRFVRKYSRHRLTERSERGAGSR